MAREQSLPEVQYRNPRFPALEIEAFTLRELARRVPPGHLAHPRRHEFHHLILFIAGRGAHFVDFERHECRAGTVLHVRPGQVQQFEAGSRLDARLILFTPAFLLSQRASHTGLVHETPSVVHLDLRRESGARVRAGFDAVTDEYEATDGGPLSTQILRHQLHALLLQLARSSQGNPACQVPGVHQRAYHRFLKELEHRFAATRRAGDYARVLGYSSRTLGRACLAASGRTAKDLIDRRVALEGKRLLAHTQLPIGTIAAETGFGDATNFVKFFRRCEAMSPSEFRARYPGFRVGRRE